MTLLIDAFNLIYKFPELEEHMYRGELVEARRGLLQRLLRLRAGWKKPIELHVFFDGKKKSGDETRRETVNEIHTYFSCDLSADHLIKEYVKRAASPGHLTVVTSDKDILYFAKRHRCQSKTSEEFALWFDSVVAPAADPGPEKAESPELSPGEVDGWMRLFREGRKKE